MTTLQIHIPDDRAAKFKATAEAQGLTLEDWISLRLAGEEEVSAKPASSPQEAAARILGLQQHVKPDPEGWTAKDYINYGRP